MRLRYSLRTLLIAVTLAGLATGWLALPTVRARAFVTAIANRDYAAAERLFADPQDAFPGDAKESQIFQPRAILKPLTWGDVIHRERNLLVVVNYGDGSGIASYTVEIKATASSLDKGMALP